MFAIGVENQLASGLTLLIGAVLALALGWSRGKKEQVENRKLVLVTVTLPLLTAFFSHLLYCLVNAGDVFYNESIGFVLAFWKRGQMMYGGMLGMMLALVLFGGSSRMQLLEAYAPSAALMTAAARLAEGFAGQGYGEYWFDEPMFFCRFPFMTYDPYYEAWGWALFMAEMLIALVLLWVLLRKKKTWNGDGMLLFLGLYAAAQIVLESLRRDEFLRWGFVRVEELFSAVVILLVLIGYCVRSGKGKTISKTICFAVFLSMVVLCLLMEFATEGRIPFLLFLDVWQCYASMAGACAIMAGCVLWMRGQTIKKD